MNPSVNCRRRVFVSYSRHGKQHTYKVRRLCDWLRENGFESYVDQYETAYAQGIPRWCEEQIQRADFVIVVCSASYSRAFGQRNSSQGRGSTFEAMLIRQALYECGCQNEKFIPVVFSGKDINHIPDILKAYPYYNLRGAEGWTGLYRRLGGTNRRITRAPMELGLAKSQPVRPQLVVPRDVDGELSNAARRVPLPHRREFVDRPKPMEKVLKSVTASRSVATVIWGMAGCGKTALAREAMHRLLGRGDFRRAVWFSPPGKLLRIEDVVDAVLHDAGSDSVRRLARTSKIEAAYRIMEGKQHLLMCDDAESVAPGDVVKFLEFIDRIPRDCRLVITTREWRKLFPTNHGLPNITVVRLQCMTEAEAMELGSRVLDKLDLRERVDRAKLANLCNACGQNPLAIELAAPQLAYLAADDLIRQLTQDPRILIDRVLEGVWERLSRAERDILVVASLSGGHVSGTIIREAVGAEQSAASMREVSAKALVDLDREVSGEQYFAIHPLTQAYALGHVSTTSKHASCRAMASHYADFLEQAQMDLAGLVQVYDRMEVELESILATLERCLERKDNVLATRILLGLIRFLWNRGHWERLDKLVHRVLRIREMCDTARARCCYSLAWVYSRRGKMKEAIRLIARAEEFISDHSSYEAGRIAHSRGQIDYRQDRFRDAEKHLKQALDIYGSRRTLRFVIGRADVWDNLGDLYRDHGLYHLRRAEAKDAPKGPTDRTESQDCFRKSLRWYRKLHAVAQAKNWIEKQATAIGDIGHVSLYLRRYARAEAHLEAALKLAQDIHRFHTVAYCHLGLGELHTILSHRRSPAGMKYLQKAREEYDVLGITAAVRQIEEWIRHAAGGQDNRPPFVYY